MPIPEKFLERLQMIIPERHISSVREKFSAAKPITVRINTIKITPQDAKQQLSGLQINFRECPGVPRALVFPDISGEQLHGLGLIEEGYLYRQSLSSMLVPVVLDPQPGERILDLCAAPGSKVTQIAAMMDNQGEIAAVEKVKTRMYKLRSVCALLGVKIADIKLMDGRRYRSAELFDRIMVDAPCSSEGRFQEGRPETYRYWSERKIKEMYRKQRGLLLNASRRLKPGGTLVYATCTFAPEENEAVIDWFLRKAEGKWSVIPVSLKGIKAYPAMLRWKGKSFNSQVKGCLRLLPSEDREGFFITKLQKR